jgi:inner membrane protein
MTSRTHDVGAFAALATAAVLYPPTDLRAATVIVALIANIVGALLPDLDQASNRLWDLLPGGNLVGKVLKKLFLGHRTLSHSILGVAIVYEITIRLVPKLFNATFVDPVIIIYAVLIGYLSHLVLDSITEEGIPLLFPAKWKFGFPPIKFLRIKTGHWVENLVIFPLLCIYVVGLGLWWLGF